MRKSMIWPIIDLSSILLEIRKSFFETPSTQLHFEDENNDGATNKIFDNDDEDEEANDDGTTYKILNVAITASIQKSLHCFKSPRRGCYVQNCLTVLRTLEY